MALFSFGSKKSKESTNQTQTNNQSSSVTTPKWWERGTQDLAANVNDFASKFGYGNVTPMQQGAMTSLTGINDKNYGSSFINGSVNPALQSVAMSYGPMANRADYALTGVTPTAGARDVIASTAYSMADPYREAYGTGVLDPALADYDTGVSRAANSYRAGTLTGAPNTRQSVAAGVLAGEAARGRGSLAAGIRSDILDKSFALGGNDAGAKLTADTGNANRSLTADMANADREQASRMANLQAEIASDSTRMAALQGMASLVQQQGENALNGESAESRNAIAQLQAAGIPIDQALQLIQAQGGALNLAVPGFGTDQSATQNLTGTSTGSSSGFSFSADPFAKK